MVLGRAGVFLRTRPRYRWAVQRLVTIKLASLTFDAIYPSQAGSFKDILQRVNLHWAAPAARAPASLKHAAVAKAPGTRFGWDHMPGAPCPPPGLPLPQPSHFPASAEADHPVEVLMKWGPWEQAPDRGLALRKLFLGLFFLMKLLITCLLLPTRCRGARRLSFCRLSQCLFMKIKSGGEVFRQKHCHLLVRGRNMKLLLVCRNMSSASSEKKQPAICCVSPSLPPCFGLRTRKHYFGTSLGHVILTVS